MSAGSVSANGSVTGTDLLTRTSTYNAEVPESGKDTSLNEKFLLAFGVPMLNDDGEPDSEERQLWWKMVRLRGKRVFGDFDEQYQPLKFAIRKEFSPAVFGREILECEHQLFTLPAKMGGLAIGDPVLTASTSYTVSKEATALLQKSIRCGKHVEPADHRQHCAEVLSLIRKEKADAQLALQAEVLARMPAAQQRTLSRIITGEVSGWFTVLPLADGNYDLSATQFRDQLALRYPCQASNNLRWLRRSVQPSAWP